jgi:CheY-like chemotaxis protein
MKKSILICEDDEGIVDVVTIVLEENGYKVESAMRGTEILNKIRKNKPNLILLDIWMPEMTGEEIARLLHANKDTKDIPIIMVSANKDLEAIAAKADADGFLPKPFDIDNLTSMVKKYIN